MLEGLKRGYAVVSINYRLSREAKWPAQIHDCKAAVRWIRANAKGYRLDPDRIAAWGGSAGGHLSAMLGTSGDVQSLEDSTQGNADQSSRVQAVVDWFGPTDFSKMDEQLKESAVEHPMHHSVSQSPEAVLLGRNPEEAPALVKEADPATYVSSLGYRKVFLELFPATGHGGEAFRTEENLNRVFSFLDKCLKQ